MNKEFYQEWPINIDVEGTYHNLGMFFDRVGRLLAPREHGQHQDHGPRSADGLQHDHGLLRGHHLRVRGRSPSGPRRRRARRVDDRELGWPHDASAARSLLAALAPGRPGRAPSRPRPPPLPPPAEPPKTDEADHVDPRTGAGAAPGGYTYNPQGRRDPFVSLQKPVAADRGPKTRKPGMEGFLIQEVALKGIVKTGGGGAGIAARPGYIAMLPGHRRQVVLRERRAAALRRRDHRHRRHHRHASGRR